MMSRVKKNNWWIVKKKNGTQTLEIRKKGKLERKQIQTKRTEQKTDGLKQTKLTKQLEKNRNKEKLNNIEKNELKR